MSITEAKLFECKRGHRFESTEASPKICPTCEESRMRFSRQRFIYRQDRRNAALERRGIHTDDRARRCENEKCQQILKGFSHMDHDDATGQKRIVCDSCGHEHPFHDEDQRR